MAVHSTEDTPFMDWWRVAVLLVGSFLVTHVLVSWLQRMRLRRIERKARSLCEEASVPATCATESTRRVPVTIVTGFLGSGKTTLVNRVLASPDHGLRVLVIENELGAISIDHELIDRSRQAAMPEGLIVLKNGCMCCSGETPGSELERVLDKLLEMSKLAVLNAEAEASSDQPDALTVTNTTAAAAATTAAMTAATTAATTEATLPFDHVLIETTGLADPAPIVQVLARREMAASAFYLDAVVTVVDAANVLRHLRPTGPFGFTRRRAEAEKQVCSLPRLRTAECLAIAIPNRLSIERLHGSTRASL